MTTIALPSTQASTTNAVLMPSVVCMNLQKAQDLIEGAGVSDSTSFDLTGADRMQIVDSSWIVVSQTPATGEVITPGSARLGVVKLSEPNDCPSTSPASTVATVAPTTPDPPALAELPVTATVPPVTTAELPVTTAELPVTTAELPVTTTKPPVTTAVPPVTTTKPPAPTQVPLDPKFGTCKEAIANGYGPYVRDVDPEYAWYRDGDKDGVVCEP